MGQNPKERKYQKKSVSSIVEKPTISEQFVTFWGTRGTIPTPNEKMLKYGGNTSCVEVLSLSAKKNQSIILDAGTGIIKCSENAILRGDRVFHLLLSHMHYDHIIGLTKFIPLFREDCEIHIYGQSKSESSLKKIVQRFFSSPYFPISFFDLPALKKIFFYELNGLKSFQIEDITIEIQQLNHPQDAIAYKVWSTDKKSNIVYATDHEHGTQKDYELEKFIKDTSLFIYDSTYTDNNYKNYVGWGHSTSLAGATIAKKAGVKYYAIFHHAPESSDEYLELKLLKEAKSIFKNSFIAAENQTINISELQALLTDK